MAESLSNAVFELLRLAREAGVPGAMLSAALFGLFFTLRFAPSLLRQVFRPRPVRGQVRNTRALLRRF